MLARRPMSWLVPLLLAALLSARAAPPRPLLLALRGERFGFLSTNGAWCAEPQFVRCGQWAEGRLWVRRAGDPPGGGVFLDESASALPMPALCDLSAVRFELPEPRFEGGLAVVGRAAGGLGYLDRAGRLIGRAPPQAALQRQDGPLLLWNAGARLGYIDRAGQVRIAARFAAASPFRAGRAAVSHDGEHWGLIDTNGLAVGTVDHDELLPFPDQPGTWGCRNGTRWGWLDAADGRVRVPPRFEALGDARGGAVSVLEGGRWGALGADGRVILSPRYEQVRLTDAGILLLASEQGRWGAWNKQGHPVREPLEDTWSELPAGNWAVSRGGRWALLDREGRERLPSGFEAIVPCQDGCAGRTNGLWRLYDRRGRDVSPDGKPLAELPASEAAAEETWHGAKAVRRGDKWALVRDADGSVLVEGLDGLEWGPGCFHGPHPDTLPGLHPGYFAP